MSDQTAAAAQIADRETTRTAAAIRAAEMWKQFTKQEKALVRIGMFPAAQMAEADANLQAWAPGSNPRDARHALVCALMDCAKADGGMRA